MPKELVYKQDELKARLDGRSIKWLAEKTEIDINRMYRLAKGDAEPTASEVARISGVLGMKPLESLVEAA